MICYACRERGVETWACAVCVDCGAGTCLEHAIDGDEAVTVLRPINMPVAIAARRRVHRCRTCGTVERERTRESHRGDQ